jgi:hypothetical protein
VWNASRYGNHGSRFQTVRLELCDAIDTAHTRTTGIHTRLSHAKRLVQRVDSETAIWDSPAWSYDRNRPGRTLDRQWNIWWTCSARGRYSPGNRDG